MARILYGVAGQGSGHASRAKIIIEHLLRAGHTLRIVSHDQGYDGLINFFPVEKITGLNITYKENEVLYIHTAIKTISKIPGATRSINKISKIVEAFMPDIVITDFEPLSALAANIYGVPLLSIDNQHIMTGTAIESPASFNREKMIIKNVVRYIIPPADQYFVTTFFYPPITNKKTTLFPPILREEVLRLKARTEDYFLVYTTTENTALIQTLHALRLPCILYGATRVPSSMAHGTLRYKPRNSETFLNDLAGCRGVIATAGFSLMSEALYLHKPYFALPVEKQFEQLLNAHYLKKLGYGDYSLTIRSEEIQRFIKRLNWYQSNLQKITYRDNHKIFAAIDAFIYKTLVP